MLDAERWVPTQIRKEAVLPKDLVVFQISNHPCSRNHKLEKDLALWHYSLKPG